MNSDYAHLLPASKFDFQLLGEALSSVMKFHGDSQSKVHRQSGVDRKTIRDVLRGERCGLEAGLKLMLYMDANPFDGLQNLDVSRENTIPHPRQEPQLLPHARGAA